MNNLELVVPALKLIFTYAFTGEAYLGGAISLAIRYGVARGVFSNEAGMGSAPIAAAVTQTDHPARQGLVSMTGTFLDTIVIVLNHWYCFSHGLYYGWQFVWRSNRCCPHD